MNFNKIADVRKLFFINSFFFATIVSIGQQSSLSVEKIECRNQYHGSKLVLTCTSNSVTKKSSVYSYDMETFINLDDSCKLILIGKLLQYDSDTSSCCINVTNWSFNGIEGCRGKPKNVNHYTIQVDALFMINRLCWPKLMELYSCSQVLYDNELKKDINSDQEKIKIVFDGYKKWYNACKIKGKIDRYFPFNDGRYVWYGGRKSIAPKNE